MHETGLEQAQYKMHVGSCSYSFKDLKDLMAKATPARSGDRLAGIVAKSVEQRVVAQMRLAELPLKIFLEELLIPYEADEVTRLIIDEHNAEAFALISHLTVGDFRSWLLSDSATQALLQQISTGLTPEMVAAVSKIMRNQDLILVAKKCHVLTAFRNTVGFPGYLSTRLQPNHPSDDIKGKAMRYFINHFEGLTQFGKVKGAPIDNNLMDQAIQWVVHDRKNAMFHKTISGAATAANA